jgi:hypothetical protein
VVVLGAAYAKSKKGNITAAEKKTLRTILDDIHEALRAGS